MEFRRWMQDINACLQFIFLIYLFGMNVISVSKLVKSYGALTAVNGVSFEVKKGEIFGLLGPNGAGKTTTLEIIEGLQLPYEAVAQDIRRELYQRVWQKSVAQYLQTLVGAADIQGIQLAGADSPLLQ